MEAMEVVGGDLHLDYSTEKLFVFHESVATLQNIASHTVALQLWHHYLSRRAKCEKIQENPDHFFAMVCNLDENYINESKKLVELLKAPRGVEEMLKKSLEKICYETKIWMNHFKYKVFKIGSGLFRYRFRNFDANYIVWRRNDEIDYKRSVSKMLKEGKLNAEQKFVLMSSYGMADELERFPMNSLSEFFILIGITDSKVAYWITHHRQDLREMWLEMPDMIRRPEDTSIVATMAMACVRSSLPYAFEHFWSLLNEDEQISFAVTVLPGSFEILKMVLSSMSSFQQHQLVDQIPIELMTNFSVDRNSAKYCMPEKVFIIWTLVKDRITEQQFVQFLENVFLYVTRSEKYMFMLNNVWDTASDRFKAHIAENHPGIIFESFFHCDPYPPSSYRLFMKFLPLVNERARKELILSEDADTLLAGRWNTDVLNLCLPIETDRLWLKNWIMESHDMITHCAEELNCLKFDEVINKVSFFSRSARDSRKFFKKLLESNELYAFTFILDYEKWNKLSNFIDTVFTNYSSTISRIKKQLISSFAAFVVHCLDEKENFNVLVKITEQVFAPEEMKTFKQTLLEHFQKTISSNAGWFRFKGKCYGTFISWCTGDEGSIDLKNIIPIDAFFDEILGNLCSPVDDNLGYYIDELDEFLKYVCGSDEEVELVKIRKYFEHGRYWIRNVEQHVLVHNRRRILNWFLSVKD